MAMAMACLVMATVAWPVPRVLLVGCIVASMPRVQAAVCEHTQQSRAPSIIIGGVLFMALMHAVPTKHSEPPGQQARAKQVLCQ